MKKYHSAFIISVVFVLILFLPFDSSAEDTYVNGFVISEDNVLKEYTGSEAHIVIPDGVTSIKEYAFNGNKDIISVSIPKSVTSIGNSAFAYCSKLERVSVGGNPVKWELVFSITHRG